MAQSQKNNESYEVLWKSVQKFENDALTKSALAYVHKISEKAKKENNSAQIVKSLLYTSKYTMTLEEDSQLKIVNDFKQEIENAESPTKNVLESYLANLYWQYFQQNRYQFYNRTKTETKIDAVDFRTWDLTTLFEEISIHFQNSLTNPTMLQKAKVNDFKAILQSQKGSGIYRPTLFDLLAHTALAFYQTNENNITRPADKFEINNPDLLCEATEFIKQELDSSDKTSLQSNALQLYQQLLRFHSTNKNLDALVEVDIERMKFVHQNAVFTNKDQLFIEVLENSSEAISQQSMSGLYEYEIATLFYQLGNSYNPKSNIEHQWKLNEAVELCDSIINRFPKSRATNKCKDLKSNIFANSLQLTAERFIPINRPSRLLVNYKNHSDLQLTAYQINQSDLKKLNELYPEPKKLAFIKKLKMTKSWEATLKNEGDYQNHSTEVLLPELDNGQYVILATPQENKNSFAYTDIQVTNLALVETHSLTHHIFQVIDRNSGQPKKEARIKLSYQENYDRSFLTRSFTADHLGLVSIPLPNKRWTSIGTTIISGDDTAYFGDYYINQKRNSKTLHKINYNAFLFTDRSIYRPGQPLYFKGITVVRENETSSVQPQTAVTVTLRDANHQEVSKQDFITNEFGSFSGELVLPNIGLTGNYSLLVSSKNININGSVDFSLEEYKRPKFETSFDPIIETYKVNDSISVFGKAMAYAGSTITNAKVTYRVKRVVNFPRWYYWYRPYFNTTPQEIAHGEAMTDASGKYEINFKALPDNSIDQESLPIFTYEVTADVTDINGETHSTSTTVRVGYHAMTTNMLVDETLDKANKDNAIIISTQNLNGQFIPAKGTIKVFKLKAPKSVLRKRPWKAPDYNGFTKTEFNRLFPHDAYEDEHLPTKWDKGQLFLDKTFDSGKSTELALGNMKKWDSGKYIIELESKDRFGQIVKDMTIMSLWSEKDNNLADKQLFNIKTDKNNYAIGDMVELTLLSSADNLNITITIEKGKKILETSLISLNNDSKTITVPVNKDDIGGFAINYSFSSYNSFSSNSIPIVVPYPKTKLEIETLTFRDKLKPGTDETWKFKIKGPKGEKVAAELLASMYDASLDAFRGHYWSFSPIYGPTYYSNFYSNANQSYGNTTFRVYNNYPFQQSFKPQYFDSFDWFGLHLGYGYGLYRERRMMKTTAPMAAMEDGEALEEGVVSEADMAGNALGIDKSEKAKEENKQEENLGDVQIRKNLQETAFFFPKLQTDKEGNVSFSFTTPEALTKWKLQLLAHTKSLQSAMMTLETVTQKELMVTPNVPRFLRQGDEIVINTKIANLTKKFLSGIAQLELTDALTGKIISPSLLLKDVNGPQDGIAQSGRQSFLVDSLGNTQVSWRLKIPSDIQAIQYKIVAKAGDFGDGEQNVLPVLTNRMLVTETLPMWVRSNQTRTFVMDKLKDNTSTSLKHHKLTLEITSNPAWYAVQALPYLMEYPHDCNEQIFSRYYANSLASHIANSNPRIQEVFDQWASSDALVSNLEKNQELKSLLIQETPWLRDAQSETEQKKRIALLFDLNKIKSEEANTLNKLKLNQMSSGAWSWFKGGRANRFITQHIITGLGHLNHLSVKSSSVEIQNDMTEKAIRYLDREFVEEYERIKKYAKNINEDHLSYTQMHYLYMRSFFTQLKTSKEVDTIMAYYKRQAKKYWTKRSLYAKGMLALILHRMDERTTANKILRSLKENSIISGEMGMYWKENTGSWYWYQAPIETQSLLIEAFTEIENNVATINNLKIWLLKNKQTNQWKTTKATTDAV
ncbi:MAG: alpha-2-macroglobulin, partial [Maribacter sp.]|nr:alpha-2-macroglobulin [Maribacter sp.]